jgi:hypothetical protein
MSQSGSKMITETPTAIYRVRELRTVILEDVQLKETRYIEEADGVSK